MVEEAENQLLVEEEIGTPEGIVDNGF